MGKTDPQIGIFLSFIQVEFGLDFLKEQWASFIDFSKDSGESYSSPYHMVSAFIEALDELTTLVYQ
jgi:hypothetical protein